MLAVGTALSYDATELYDSLRVRRGPAGSKRTFRVGRSGELPAGTPVRSPSGEVEAINQAHFGS
jgi:hypothetical protein